MPVALAWLVAQFPALATFAGLAVAWGIFKVAAGLGLAFVTYQGVSAGFEAIQTLILANLSGVSADLMQLVELGGYRDAMAIILGTWLNITAARVLVMGKRLIWK